MAQVQKTEDIAPGLIKTVQDAVNANVRANQRLASLRALIADGRATYKDAAEYALEYGNMVKQAMAANVSSAVLPDGKMYWNITDKLFDQIMTQEFSEISQQCEQVQTALNQAAGIGVKAQVLELDPEKIKGVKEYASRADQYDDVKASTENALVTYSQSLVDESVRRNADFQAKSGMHPRIIRSAAPGCCRWCTMLAGSYDYPEDTPDDVFRRHANCNCVVEYYPGDGKRQNVWTKVWRTVNRAEDNQYYKPIVGNGNVEKFSRKGVVIDAEELEGYENVYKTKDAHVKPRGVHETRIIINEAYEKYGLQDVEKPKIVFVTQAENRDAYGAYNRVDNVLYITDTEANKTNNIPDNKRKERTMYHEVWHFKQAIDYQKKYDDIKTISQEVYIERLQGPCKENLDRLGITYENVSEIINEDARKFYLLGYFDEVEAELYGKYWRSDKCE